MFNIKPLKDEALTSLLGIIDSINGQKVLILDRSLAATLSTVASFSLLKDHGIDKIYWLNSPNLSAIVDLQGINSVVYLSSTDFNCMTQISSHAKSLITNSTAKDVHVIMTPYKTLAFTHVIEESGLLGDITIHSWNVYFLPIDTDIISLNLPNGGFQDLYLDQLPSTVHLSAQALHELQIKHGLFGRISGKGDQAAKLVEILKRKRNERKVNLADIVTGENKAAANVTVNDVFDLKFQNLFVGTTIDQLVVIDRQIDLVTPLLTQLTYQGLIDEFYMISDSGQVELPATIVSPPQKSQANTLQTSETKKTTLITSVDKEDLFTSIRDLNFSVVGQTLNKVARQLQSDYEQRHEAKTVSQIKDFVGRLGGLQAIHQSLRFHTSLAEDLMAKVQSKDFNRWLEIQQNIVAGTMGLSSEVHPMIEDLIDRSANLSMVLRVLSLDSLCNGGIKSKDLQFFKREILQTYGYNHLVSFSNLEKLGLIYSRSPQITNTYPIYRKTLSLISDQPEQNEGDENTDISFTYSGYAPLSVRLVQCIIDKNHILSRKKSSQATTAPTPEITLSSGFRGTEDLIKTVPGPLVDEIQRSEDPNAREPKLRKVLTRNTALHKPTTIVYYLGGITHAEVAAIRFVASRLNMNVVIATTGFISGDKLIDLACKY